MGAPKFQRKKYSKPGHPWQRDRIEDERVLTKEYGLKNKKEIWKADSFLRNLKDQAKKLIQTKTPQARTEEELFRKRLAKYDLLPATFILEDILSLNLKDILNLRLQTLAFKQGLAKTVGQARQLIVHGHILVNGKKIDVPSYKVLKTDRISYSSSSKLSNSDHPERPQAKHEVKTQLELPKKKEETIEKPKETKKKTPAKKKKEEKVPSTHELAAKKKEIKK